MTKKGMPPAVRFSPKQSNTLFALHIAAAVVMGAQSVSMFALAAADGSMTIPVYSVRIRQWTPDGEQPQPPSVVKVGSIYVQYLSAIFTILACIDHTICAASWDCWYRRLAERGHAYPRWIEYFFSAPIMNINILALCNGAELQHIVAVFALTATTMIFGAISDLSNNNRNMERLWAFVGCVPFIGAWEIILYDFSATVGSNPNAYVVAIIVCLPILESSFAVVKLVKSFSRKSAEASFNYELAFIVLSFTSKTLLAWLQEMGSRQITQN